VPANLVSLAQTQFQTYATLLAEPQSCLASTGGRPDDGAVDHARIYLNGFGGFQHIYQSMLANAGKQSLSVRFNDKFPGSARYIVDSYEVPGAFTKTGYSFMQNAIQHPDPYFSGEEWVLGPTAGSMPDGATLISQLQKHYVADYLTQWRNYMNAARFVGFHDWNDAAEKLSALDSNYSAILQLFSLVSINTGVVQPDIVAAFQAPQSVVPPSGSDNRFTTSYIQALQGLEQAIKTVSQNPLSANDPAAATPIIQAAGMADQAAENLRNSFHHDPDGEMDTVSFNRLEDPIKSADALAKSAPAKGAGEAAKAFCAQAAPVFAKFPFNPQSKIDASPDAVAQIFSPGQGALAQFYSKISQLIIPQGGQYVANPATAIGINPAFLRFFTAAKKVSSALFPAGGNQPTLTLTIAQPARVAGSPDAVLDIDGQQVSPGQTVPILWVSQPSSRITLRTAETVPTFTGPWSIFHLAFSAERPAPNLEFSFQFSHRTYQVVLFNVEGLGAPLLNRDFMNQLHCVATVAKP
jgi:type VI secretion system protein ImpL